MVMDLKEDLKKKKAIFGSDVNTKQLLNGKLSKLYLASNCKDKDTFLSLAQKANVEVTILAENNKELGTLCKKPFSLSVIGFE